MLGLKSFHVFFICVSILLCLWVGVWGVQRYIEAASTSGLALAIIFLLGGGALLVYAFRYFGKLKRLDG